MRAIVVAALVSAAAALVLGAGSAARAQSDSTRGQVLDRTYACAVFVRGGAYLITARAHAGTRSNGSWARLPYAGVRSGVFSGGAGNLVAWITSGKPVATTLIDQDYDAFDVKTYGTVGVRRDSCRRSSASVSLAPAGLRGGAAEPLGTGFECFVPRQVLVRVRAVFPGAGSLHAGRDFQTAHVPVRQAKLAVRSIAGKPLVYAAVRDDGQARLYTATSCSPD